MKKNQKYKIVFFKKKIKDILFFLFSFFLSTQFGKHWFMDFAYVSGVKIDYLSFILYFTDILFIAILIANLKLISKNIIKTNRTKKIFFLILTIINILLSKYYLLGLYHFFKILELYLIYLIFSKQKNYEPIVLGFFYGGILQLFIATLQFINKSSLNGLFYFLGERNIHLYQSGIAKISILGQEFLRPYGTFSHPNSMAGFYLLLYFYFLFSKKIDIKIKKIALFVFGFLILLSFSKATFIFFTVLNIGYLFIEKKVFINLKNLLLFFFFILFFIFIMNFQTDPLSLQKRIMILNNSLSIIINNFIFGVGIGHYLIYQACFPSKFSYFFLQPVHNIFLLIIAELGVFFSSFIFIYLVKEFKKIINKNIFIFCFLTIFLTGNIDHYWITLQQNWLLLGVIFGLIKQEL